MKEQIILIGAGGHAKSVIDSIDELRYDICGFIDTNKKGYHCGIPILGAELEEIPNYKYYKYFVSIGDVIWRKIWFEKLVNKGLEIINIIDSSAIISKSARIGVGNYIGKMVVINADAEIGDNNIINSKALVEHECIVGSNTHLSTNSVINGNVTIENDVFLGSSAVCNGQLKIGQGAIIGSGSVVIRSIPPMVTAVGVPAKIIKGDK